MASTPDLRVDLAFSAMVTSPAYAKSRAALEAAFGLDCTLLPARDLKLEDLMGAQRNAFCDRMARRSRACRVCLKESRQLLASGTRQELEHECFAGLRRTSVPVRAACGRPLGLLQTTSARVCKSTQQADGAASRQTMQSEALRRGAPRAALPELWRIYSAIPAITSRQYEAAIEFVRLFAEHLALIAERVLSAPESEIDPPAVEKARRFILASLKRPLSLSEIARVAGLSPTYFSTVFHRALGLPLREYLAQVRIERAKALLGHPHLRTEQVAQEVGYRSRSQFNRTFRRLVGLSPKDFRRETKEARDLSKHDRPTANSPRAKR